MYYLFAALLIWTAKELDLVYRLIGNIKVVEWKYCQIIMARLFSLTGKFHKQNSLETSKTQNCVGLV